MGFLSLLKDKCNIESETRAQSGTGEVTKTWANKATNVCTRFHTATRERVLDGDYQVTIEDFVFYFEAGTDIAKADRIVVGANAYEVMAVVEHSTQHHLTAYARVVDFK